MNESVTITDNRTGESIDIPIINGGVDAGAWKKLLGNIWFADPGFTQTAATESAITELDGEAGILRYRGYPIEQLAESSTYLEVAYLLLNGELPNEIERNQIPIINPARRCGASLVVVLSPTGYRQISPMVCSM